MNTRPALIYISGPITTGGNVPVNVRRGIEAGVLLMDAGYVVIVPHEKAFGMEMLSPRSYEDWMAYDFKCIEVCDAVYRMSDWRGNPLPSVGGDRETEYARAIGKPVYHSLDTLKAGVPADRYIVPAAMPYRVDVGNGSCPGFIPPQEPNDWTVLDAIVEDLDG